MADKNLIDISRLKQLVYYEPMFGSFTWQLREPSDFRDDSRVCARKAAEIWNARYAGEDAFNTLNNSGYLEGRIDGKTYLAHRVAWACHYGEWPADQIDHINGVTTDNSIANLREADSLVNGRNSKLRHDNKSGTPGISWDEGCKSWLVQIGSGEHREYIGRFKKLAAAKAARRKAEARLNYHANHGRLQ